VFTSFSLKLALRWLSAAIGHFAPYTVQYLYDKANKKALVKVLQTWQIEQGEIARLDEIIEKPTEDTIVKKIDIPDTEIESLFELLGQIKREEESLQKKKEQANGMFDEYIKDYA
jgi:hypothetical protein